jgi:hypothetical protein
MKIGCRDDNLSFFKDMGFDKNEIKNMEVT